MSKGRSCPPGYRYVPASLCSEPSPVTGDVLYIVGGLYGNPLALDEIERLAQAEEREGRRVRLIFNGDFNWFNASDDLFGSINRRVLRHTVTLGNVELELTDPSAGAGCGCAYPGFVDEGVVKRSNAIMARLQTVALHRPDILGRLSQCPRYLSLIFGHRRLLVLHGDPQSLAGWGLSRESFGAGNERQLTEWFRRCTADVIACTHTCLPLLWSGCVDGRSRIVVNNGSAGMGNLCSDPRGLITRIARSSPAAEPVAALESHGLHLALLPVAYDLDRWLRQFDRLWPAGTAAAVSYRERMVTGTSLNADDLILTAQRS